MNPIRKLTEVKVHCCHGNVIVSNRWQVCVMYVFEIGDYLKDDVVCSIIILINHMAQWDGSECLLTTKTTDQNLLKLIIFNNQCER